MIGRRRGERALEAALEACLEELAAGRDLDAVLAARRDLAIRLRPLLEASQSLQRASRDAPAPSDPERRARFMTALRATPQQRPRTLPRLPRPRAHMPRLGVALRGGAFAGAAAGLAGLALVLVLSQGASPAYASTLTVFGGAVERLDGEAWLAAGDGSALEEGARVRTGEDGEALITFADGSTAGLEPGSDVEVVRARLAHGREITIRQHAGSVWNQVAPGLEPGTYRVETANAVVVAQGTAFEIVVAGGETTVLAREGVVEVQAGSDRAVVHAGETRAVRGGALLEVATDARGDLALTVDAPFVASLVAPDGKATGVRPDGAVYQQITGGTTSNPAAGPQLIRLAGLDAGDYLLHLRRVADGTGELVVEIEGRTLRLGLAELARLGFDPDHAGTLVVRLHVARDGDALRIEPRRVPPSDVARNLEERVVLPEAARARATQLAGEIAAGVAGRDYPSRDRERPQPPGQDRPPQPGATATADAAPRDRVRPDVTTAPVTPTGDTRPSDRPPADSPTSTATPSILPVPTALPLPTRTATPTLGDVIPLPTASPTDEEQRD